MSPNEFQLRAALRDGEGEHVSADTVIARARGMQQARHDRRVRYGSVAAVVAVVGGIGVVGGIALNGGGNNMASSAGSKQSAADRAARAGGGQVNGPVPVASPGPLAGATAVPCPATVPQVNSAGAPSDGTGSLFSGPVEAIKICGYQEQGGAPITGTHGTPLSTVLTGQRATALAASLDAAPSAVEEHPCPLYRTADGKTLVIIGFSTSGKAMTPITAVVEQNPCNQAVTNGSAIRYNWSPPASLDDFIAQFSPTGGATSIAPSGKVTGSPIQS